jgi:hypothetical protein
MADHGSLTVAVAGACMGNRVLATAWEVMLRGRGAPVRMWVGWAETDLVMRQLLLDDPRVSVVVLVPEVLVRQWVNDLTGRLALGRHLHRVLAAPHRAIADAVIRKPDLLVIDEAHRMVQLAESDEELDRQLTLATRSTPGLLLPTATPMDAGASAGGAQGAGQHTEEATDRGNARSRSRPRQGTGKDGDLAASLNDLWERAFTAVRSVPEADDGLLFADHDPLTRAVNRSWGHGLQTVLALAAWEFRRRGTVRPEFEQTLDTIIKRLGKDTVVLATAAEAAAFLFWGRIGLSSLGVTGQPMYA